AGRGTKTAGAGAATSKQSSSAVVRKAVYETSRKKEVGVSDLTLLSKISNESINENLRKRFEHREIYVPYLLISGLILSRPISAMYLSASTRTEIWGSILTPFLILIADEIGWRYIHVRCHS